VVSSSGRPWRRGEEEIDCYLDELWRQPGVIFFPGVSARRQAIADEILRYAPKVGDGGDLRCCEAPSK
jgi:hypothetical protein